jgi:O-antigen/teichoic acid export membrane protein
VAATVVAFRILSRSEASVFTVATSIGVLLNTLDMGLPAAYVTRVASSAEAPPPIALAHWLAARLAPILLTAVGVAALVPHIAPGISGRSATVFMIVTGFTLIALAFAPFERALYAKERYAHLDRAALVGFGVSAAIVVVGLHQALREARSWFFLFGACAPATLTRLACRERGTRRNQRRFRYADLPEAPHYLVTALLGGLAFSIDPLVSLVVGSQQVAVDVAIAARMFSPAVLLGSILGQSAWPAIVRLRSTESSESAVAFYANVTRKVVGATSACVVTTIALSPLIARLLTAHGSRPSVALTGITAVWTIVYCWGNLLGQIHAATSDTRWVMKAGARMTICNVILSVTFGWLYGGAGVVAGSIASYVPLFLVPSLRRIPGLLVAPASQALSHASTP